MTTYNKIFKLFLLPVIAVLLGTAVTGCKDDEGLSGGEYGYVQFRLYKKNSYVQEGETPAAKASRVLEIDSLAAIQKVEVELTYNGTSITQTLVLNSYNEDNAEYGMRSDKLELMAGKYTLVGYKLLDKVDEVRASESASGEIEILPGQLTVKDLTADITGKGGQVQFRLVKKGLSRAVGENEKTYLFSDIDLISVTLRNTFTQDIVTCEKIPVKYAKEYEGPDAGEEGEDDELIIGKDKYYTKETAVTDSLVWVPAGDYKVIEYTTYKKSGVKEYYLEAATGLNGASFTVEDNNVTREAEVPVILSETDENIKDYMALREIWEELHGEDWSYVGDAYPAGANWNFNKEMDMWGQQPGVGLNDEGRVISLSLTGFRVNGVVPDAIGQLTELKVLAFGAHDEKLGGSLTASLKPDMSEAQKKKMRENYANLFLKRDSREDLSEMLQWVINNDSKQKSIKKYSRIEPKDVQVGTTTNNITAISKAVMRLTKLQNLFIANSTIDDEMVFTDWAGDNTSYREAWAEESWSWSNFKDLTDMELYNCPNFDEIPAFVMELPELQVLNLACNPNMKMKEQWNRLVTGEKDGSVGVTPVASKIQMLYLGYNDLEEFPPYETLNKMKNLHMLDCVNSNVKKLHPFGEEIVLAQLMLDNNEIEVIPDEDDKKFCQFSNDVESLSFKNNKITVIPDIFDASSVYVMGSIDFSNNLLGADDNYSSGIKNKESFKGINVASINLANNKLKEFPKELFRAESPITTLNLSGNEISEIKEGDITQNYKGGLNKNAKLLTTIDLRFNKLSSLPEDFRATGMPYLKGFDVGYNCFSKVPEEPLNCSVLQAIGVRCQRDADGKRILRDWPLGITKCPSLLQLQIGSNDIRKVEEDMTSRLWIVEVKDNPNISMDVTSVCPYINAGMWMLIYDKTQDIRGCDALGIEK